MSVGLIYLKQGNLGFMLYSMIGSNLWIIKALYPRVQSEGEGM